MHFRIDPRPESLASQIRAESGVEVRACDQAGLCTAVCPVVHAFDFTPHQVVRLVQLDQDDRIKHLAAPWLCTLCGACSEACPQRVDVAALMAALRRRTRRDGADSPPEVESIRSGTESFLSLLESRGRVSPVSLVIDYKLRSLDVWSDLSLSMPWLSGALAMRGPGRPTKVPEMPEVTVRHTDEGKDDDAHKDKDKHEHKDEHKNEGKAEDKGEHTGPSPEDRDGGGGAAGIGDARPQTDGREGGS